jgi:hypothetical protein
MSGVVHGAVSGSVRRWRPGSEGDAKNLADAERLNQPK